MRVEDKEDDQKVIDYKTKSMIWIPPYDKIWVWKQHFGPVQEALVTCILKKRQDKKNKTKEGKSMNAGR